MERRAAILIASTMVLLAGSVIGLSASLYRDARRSVDELLQRRLEAVGTTAARLVTGARDADNALSDLAVRNELDGAYLFDERFILIADAHGHAGQRANLLRVDPDRARAAISGHATVGWAFDLDGLRFLGGYFPASVEAGQPPLGLAIEAGEAFTAPSRRLQIAAVLAFGLEGALSVLALGILWRAVAAARRERAAFGRAERAAVASQMAAMVAHEVRNPLGIMRAGAELLRERLPRDGERELVDDILGEVTRLNALTEEFLILARDQPPRCEPFDVAALCSDLCEKLKRRYANGLTVEERLESPGMASAEAAKIRQALLNLLINAAQATEGRGLVTIEARREGDRVLIAVSDDGPGVPEGMREHLFEPFRTGKATGTGLGLAVARRIIEQHGGGLKLAPSSSGARFALWLPCEPRK